MNKSSGLILFPLQQKSLTLLIQGVMPVIFKEEGQILIYSWIQKPVRMWVIIFFAQEIWVRSTFQVRGHSYEFLCLTWWGVYHISLLSMCNLESMPQEGPQNTAFGIRKGFVMQILLTCETSQPELWALHIVDLGKKTLEGRPQASQEPPWLSPLVFYRHSMTTQVMPLST